MKRFLILFLFLLALPAWAGIPYVLTTNGTATTLHSVGVQTADRIAATNITVNSNLTVNYQGNPGAFQPLFSVGTNGWSQFSVLGDGSVFAASSNIFWGPNGTFGFDPSGGHFQARNQNYVWPASRGANGSVLVVDSSGNLSWVQSTNLAHVLVASTNGSAPTFAAISTKSLSDVTNSLATATNAVLSSDGVGTASWNQFPVVESMTSINGFQTLGSAMVITPTETTFNHVGYTWPNTGGGSSQVLYLANSNNALSWTTNFTGTFIGDGSGLTNLSGGMPPTNGLDLSFPVQLILDHGTNKYVNGPKVYRALLTQTNTTAPVATVLENSLSAVPTWSYGDIGSYQCTLTGEFPTHHTFVRCSTTTSTVSSQNQGILFFAEIDLADIQPDGFVLNIYTATTGTQANGDLYDTPIEILVYP